MKTTNIFYRAMCLVLMALCSVFASGQSTNTFNPSLPQLPYLSPEAASLGKYGEIPVSEYTGVPEISVPLHTVRIGELEFPLSLTYHASGIKVAQEATWVGLGWDLQAGGCINQIISGSYDKKYTVNTPWNRWEAFFSQNFYMAFPTFGDNSCWGGVEENPNTFYYPLTLYQDLMYGMGEPDIYQANFCGHSFKYIIHPNTRQPMIVGEDNDQYVIKAMDSNLRSWKITDAEGIDYYFEQEGAEVVKSQYQDYTSSWFLTRIVHPQKGHITLEYETEGNLQMKLQPALAQEYVEATYASTLLSSGVMSAGSPNSDLLGKKNYLQYSNSIIEKKYLKRIVTDLEEINFHKSGRSDIEGYCQKLDSMIVKNYKGQIVNRTVFSYNYYTGVNIGGDYMQDVANSATNDYRIKRLKLEGITVNERIYAFEYDATPLPYKTSYAADFWGYYNGQYNTSFLCTANARERYQGGSPRSLGNANRYVTPSKIQAGILKKIVYPTKGYTLLEYEPNTFVDNDIYCPTSDKSGATVTYEGFSYGGGLRVVSIGQYEADGTLLGKQKYEYTNDDGKTSGKLLLPIPKIQNDILFVGIYNQNIVGGGITTTGYALDQWNTYTVSSTVKIPAFTSLFALPVGYSQVTKKIIKDNVTNGRTVSSFYNTPVVHHFYDTYLINNCTNGKMTQRRHFNTDNQLVRKHEWKYTVPGASNIMLNAFAKDIAPGIPDCGAFFGIKRYRIQAYPFYIRWITLREETVTDYFYENGDTTQISHVTQYEYNVNNHRPSSITHTTSVSDEILKTEIKYADNFSGTAAYDSLLAKNMVNLPVETIEYRNNTVLSRSKNEYTLFNGKPYLSSLKWVKGNNAYETRMQYTKYDTDGNLLEYVRPDGVTVSQLWSYKNQYPIVQVEGMSYSTMTSVLGSGYVTSINTGIEGINQLRSIYNQLSSGLVSAQSYSPLIGISGSIDSEGNLYRYTYDTYGRLSQISDINNSVINQFEYNYK